MAAITDLSTVGTVGLSDYLVLNQSGTDYKAPWSKFVVAGTWTPTLNFGAGGTGITYGTQTGTYVKIGSLVMIQATIVLSSKGSSTGTAYVINLPFAAGGSVAVYPFPIIWTNAASNHIAMFAALNTGTSYLVIQGATAAATSIASLTNAAFTNTSSMVFSGCYYTA